MFKYDYLFTKIKDMRVYHDGSLTIYLRYGRLYWNRYGVLQAAETQEVEKYFELH